MTISIFHLNYFILLIFFQYLIISLNTKIYLLVLLIIIELQDGHVVLLVAGNSSPQDGHLSI